MTSDSPETCYGCEMPTANCNCRFAGLGEDDPKADDLGLAPCPFCGGAADIDHDHTVEESHAYGCRKCGIWFNDYLADDPIAAWNRRPGRSPAEEVREIIATMPTPELRSTNAGRGDHALTFRMGGEAMRRQILAALFPDLVKSAPSEKPCPVCGSEDRGQGGHLSCQCPAPEGC